MSSLIHKQTLAQERSAKKYDIATVDELRTGPAKYRWDVIERDAGKLLEAAPGTIRNDFIDYMAGIYLSCCFVERVLPPESVYYLVVQQLNGRTFGVKGDGSAIDDALRIIQEEPGISKHKLAKNIGVAPKTIRRWISDGLLPWPDEAPNEGGA